MAGGKFVLIIPDGAPDLYRAGGRSPLTTARMAHSNEIARRGVSGLMRTLYDDLPRGSIVAQLGMLGWDPYRYFPHGRASCELLALDGVRLHAGDLAFRANLVCMEGRRLASYNACYIPSSAAAPLLDAVRQATSPRFPGFELHHICDFRNALVIRGAGLDPRLFHCPEPHESEGLEFEAGNLVTGKDAPSRALARTINEYLLSAAAALAGRQANMLFVWSPSGPLELPRFADQTGFAGRVGVVAAMHFLHGIARAGGVEFVKVGDGSPETDYAAKGAATVELLAAGCSFVVCHVNGPDEASHMGDLALKVSCLERIDRHVVGPVLEWFDLHPHELGGLMIAPDHYTNHRRAEPGEPRWAAHSTHPVPFTLWNGRDADRVSRFGEDDAREGRYGARPVSHLDLLGILGLARRGRSHGEIAAAFRGRRPAPPSPAIAPDERGPEERGPDAMLGRQALLELDPAVGRQRLAAQLRDQAARLIGIDPATLDLERPLTGAGLDSLAAAELHGAIESGLGVSIGMPELLDGVSAAGVAAQVLAALADLPAGAAAEPAGDAEPAGRAHPLSPNQQALWFLHQLDPGSDAYHVALAARTAVDLDLRALRLAVQALVDRHEALRTAFTVGTGGRPEQRVLARLAVEVEEVDAAGYDEARLLAELSARAAAPFDLANGRLLRVAYLRRAGAPHALLLAAHHIALDGWSFWVLLDELCALVPAFQAGDRCELPRMPWRFRDYLRWQAELLAGEAGERSWSHWRSVLAGELPVPQLPADRPRPALAAGRAASCGMGLPEPLVDRLRQLGRAHDATLYALLLAAFQALLHRYGGQRDLLLGSPLSGRSRPELAAIVGCIFNVLPLRATLSEETTFAELLAGTRGCVLRALAHQDYPGALLAERLQPERGPGRLPLFQQVLFILQRPQRGGLAMPRLAGGEPRLAARMGAATLELFALPRRHARSDLELEVIDAGRCAATLHFNGDLFDRATILRMAGHLAELLAGAAAEPHARLDALPMLRAAERWQLEAEWHGGAAGLSPGAGPGAGVYRQFRDQARRSPRAVAVVAGGVEVSYADLAHRAARVGRRLRRLGVRPGALVGICLDRCPELLEAMLGVLAAGCAYLPLDPAYPPERLERMIADGRPVALLSRGDGAGEAPRAAAGIRVARLDAGPPAASRGPAAATAAAELPDRLIYVIFTSGSTGRPKGAGVYERGFLNLLHWYAAAMSFAAADRHLITTSFSFDLTQKNLLGPLLVGASVHLAPTGPFDPAALAATIERSAITVVDCTPSAWYPLLEHCAAAGWQPLRSLRLVILGGEPMALPPLWPWLTSAGNRAELWNSYGPTECTDLVTAFRFAAGGGVPASAPIGRPIQNVGMRVVGRHLATLPIGAVGELAISGAAVGMGYLGDGALTAARFVPAPATPGVEAPGGRLYLTGDLARFLPDGNLEVLGRRDQQVKLRGFRVELGEIESVLAEHPRVRRAAVTVLRDGPGSERLVACLVAPDLAPAAHHELAAFLRARLPEHMIPAAFVALPSLPLTASGKVDRKTLPSLAAAAVDAAGAAGAAGGGVPCTPSEELLAGLCAEVLGVPRLGRDDNFFDLGCHSLLATKIIARARELFALELPVASLFDGPTVRQLAAVVDGLGQTETEALPPIAPAPRDGDLPLSFAQERIWFLTQLDPGLRSYYVPRALRVAGPLPQARVAQAFDEIIRRHEILRTTFPAVDGRPVQVVHPPRPILIPLLDLAALAAPVRDREMRRLILAEGRRPFDLERGPLLRLALLRLAAEEHVLQMTEHHLVHDGWTQGVLLRDFLAIYGAFSRGEPSPLPELPVQYADFACWQRRWLRDEALARQLDFWQARLAQPPDPPALPFDRPRPAVQSFAGAQQTWVLPAALCRALRARSRQLGGTLFMTMLSAFATVLHRYSGQDDLCVGTGVANRRVLEVEGLLGMLINTLVLRCGLSGDPGFAALVERIRRVCIDAYGHQDLPFERLVAALHPERTLSHTPLFQVFFAFMDTPSPDLELPGLALSVVDAHNRSAKFDLNMTVLLPAEQRIGIGTGAGRDEITLLFEHSTDVFDPPTIQRMLRHFEVLLAGVAADAGRRLSDLPLLSPVEEHELRVEWNETVAALPDEPCVHQLFAAQARRSPAARAVACGPLQLTYRELEGMAHQVARALLAQAIGRGARVGVCVERSPAMIAALLGILERGAAYVPLDPALPAERLAYVVADARLDLVVADPGSAPALAGCACRVLPLADGLPALDGPRTAAPAVAVGGSDPAYVIYTSGSTGRPKGVVVSHRAVANFLASMRRRPGMTARDVLLAVTTLSFDIAGLELLLPLAVGACVVVASRDTAADAASLIAALAEGITTMQATPATWRMLLDAGWQGDRRLQVLCGGEALPRVLADRLLAMGETVWNLYGPSETTIWSAAEKVVAGSRPVPLGKPIANTRIHLLDRAGNLVPAGVAGELHIAGAGLAQGYLGRPDLTAAAFLPDPFGAAAGARLYRTGDLARRLGDGTLEFLGRGDHQVKVRGFRIELGEIEAALARHPAVRQGVVVAVEDGPAQRRLAAYLVAAGGERPGMEELRRFLGAILPDYMLPSAVEWLEALPLTPSGKVDRRALPRPGTAQPGTAAGFVAPDTEIERILAGIWQEVLEIGKVGLHDSFFALGGHSLLATRVLARVRRRLGVELPLRSLFAAPTVAGMAAAAAARLRAGDAAAPPIVRVERGGALPLSFAQQRLWFLAQLDPESPAYHIAQGVRVRGRLDAAALGWALAEAVRRHEALRTCFAAATGEPVQVIVAAAAPALPVVDLAGLSADLREALAGRLAQEQAARRFDLARGPLLRLLLLRLGAADHLAVLVLHHVVADNWSMGVLVREVAALYAARIEGAPSPLPALPIQYVDFAVWQRRWLAGRVLAQELAFWRHRLAGAPPLLALPTDRPRPAVRRWRAAMAPLAVPAPLARRLEEASRQREVTLFMFLLAGLQIVLARYADEERVDVGTAAAGRHHLETEGLIGCFVNTLVLAGDLSGGPAAAELLSRVRDTTLAAFAHQDLPFERLVEELQPQRSLASTPLFQVMLTLHNAPRGSLEVPGLSLELRELLPEAAKFDLSLALATTATGLGGRLVYDADLFDPPTVARLAGHWLNLLGALAAAAGDRPVEELPWLAAAERAQLLREWNDTGAAEPRPCPVHELVERHARLTPDRPAVVDARGWLTYGELNRLANLQARRLRRLGVGPETVVGLGAERSAGLVIGMLAVLKAGGAYAPLDPAWPRRRLAVVLAETAAPVVLAGTELAGPLPGLQRPPLWLPLPGGEANGAGAAPVGAAGGENLEIPLAPESLAYVIHTSGSTGGPKGVAVEHRQLANYVQGVIAGLDLAACGSFALASTPAADLGYTALFPALATGACLHLLSRETATESGAFARYCERHAIDCLKITPSHLSALQADDRSGRGLPRRRLVLGGEAARREEVEDWRARVAGCRIFNHYGPTETTVGVLTHRVDEAGAGRPVPLGRPLPAAAVYVLDRRQRPVPVGVPGELAVGGAGVARGYPRRPAETAERFIPDPFGEPGGRLYRTGDLARLRPDGVREFLGRVDRQVKVRGHRVEPDEVAAVLARHPAVGEAVVAARGEGRERRLVAYLVAAAAGEEPPSAEIVASLRREVPEFMLPAAVVWLPAIPLTANGKVDLAALPAPAAEAAAGPAAGGPFAGGPLADGPLEPLAELLAAMWGELLGRERVGMGDDFFALGGHSLLATQLTSRVRQVLGVEVPLRSLFEAPTVAELAARIAADRRRRAAGGGPQPPPIAARARPANLPLSFAQERLWFLDQLDPGRATYNLPYFVRLHGCLQPAALARALREIVRRHEAMRTTIGAAAGEPAQVVGPVGGAGLRRVDLSALPAAKGAEEAGRLAAAEAARPFDLWRGPLWRSLLVALAVDDHLLLLTLHHVVSDAWSRGVLAHELAVLYAAFAAGRPSPLPDLPCQYADFAIWQRQWLQGAALASQLAFWRACLGDAQPPALPYDRAPSAARGRRGGQVRLALPPRLAAALADLARNRRVTFYMVLVAGFAALLHRCSAQRSIVVGSPIANRNRKEIEGLIGFFANLLALRLDVPVSCRAGELLERARAVTLEAYEHQDLPFEKLVEDLHGGQPRQHTPFLNAVLQLHNAPMPALDLPGLRGEALAVHNGTVKFDLTLSVSAGEEGFSAALEHDLDLFDTVTVRRLLGHFQALLTALAAGDERPVGELPLLGEGERMQLFVEWNDTGADYPREATVHQLFARQAARRPAAPALVFDGEELTYAELDRRANRLAHRLRALGVGPEVPVALAMPRSVAAVVAIVAILKAGGAYLPLDPGHPRERLQFMLDDARAPVLVTAAALAVEPPGVRVLRLDLDPGATAAGEDGDPGVAVAPGNLAYMMYTSGSTGRPKAVCIPHRAICRLLYNTNYLELERGLSLVHAANLAFDAATFEIWGALLHGGCLVGLRQGTHLTAAELARLGGGRRIDALYVTCPLFNQIAADADDAFAAVGAVLFGGEAADVRFVRKVAGEKGPARLLHVYGPTEATTFASFERIAEAPPAGAAAISIGRPLANTDLYVAGERLEPAAIGVPGELLIGGDGLARGYWRQPALTAERFVPDPFSGRPGAVLYRSGDRVCWRPDGRLEFLGRLDSQVKIRGFRIEPGEIEAALAEHPAVLRAVIAVREDAHLGRHLVAYVVAAGDPAAHRELRRYLKDRLPDHMVPAFFVDLAALPLNNNGKVDYAALPAPVAAAPAAAPPPPETPIARGLAAIWSGVLGRDVAGVDEDFFSLGGHSLLATRVLTQVREEFKVEVPLRRFWESPTIADLEAEIIGRQLLAAGETEVAALLAEVEHA